MANITCASAVFKEVSYLIKTYIQLWERFITLSNRLSQVSYDIICGLVQALI